MTIEEIFPQVIGKKDRLVKQLIRHGQERGLPREIIQRVADSVPDEMEEVLCFFNKITKSWTYEYGEPIILHSGLAIPRITNFGIDDRGAWWKYNVATEEVIGKHMCPEVEELLNALLGAVLRLPPNKQREYIKRLANRGQHRQVLTEMVPVHHLPQDIPAEFEVKGIGQGDRTVDWLISPPDGRAVALEVKMRKFDLRKHLGKVSVQSVISPPDHETKSLFRDVERKFAAADPDRRLQGVWVFPYTQQPEKSLLASFNELCPSKIHFVILGDWQQDIYILARRKVDEHYLYRLFRGTPSSRFTFPNTEVEREG